MALWFLCGMDASNHAVDFRDDDVFDGLAKCHPYQIRCDCVAAPFEIAAQFDKPGLAVFVAIVFPDIVLHIALEHFQVEQICHAAPGSFLGEPENQQFEWFFFGDVELSRELIGRAHGLLSMKPSQRFPAMLAATEIDAGHNSLYSPTKI